MESLSALSIPKTGVQADPLRTDSLWTPDLAKNNDQRRDVRIESLREFEVFSAFGLDSDRKNIESGKKRCLIAIEHYVESHRESSCDTEDEEKEDLDSREALSKSRLPIGPVHVTGAASAGFKVKNPVEKKATTNSQSDSKEDGRNDPEIVSEVSTANLSKERPKTLEDTHSRDVQAQAQSSRSAREDILCNISHSSRQSEVQKSRKLAERLNRLIGRKKQTERKGYGHFNGDTEAVDPGYLSGEATKVCVKTTTREQV